MPQYGRACKSIATQQSPGALDNLQIMVPFVRTLDEARGVVNLLEENGLKRGDNGLRLIMMCELPSNAVLADDVLAEFDGFS